MIAPKTQFKKPDGIIKLPYCAVSGLLPSASCAKAGFVVSDYFNIKDVPKQTNDSLIEGNYVEIGDKKSLAADKTPKDISNQGLMLNPVFIRSIVGNEFTDYNQIIPKKTRGARIFIPK